MAETFGSKLKQIREDLGSIAERMNRDRSYDVALAAQQAIIMIDGLEGELDTTFGNINEFPWDWQPGSGGPHG